MLTVRTSENTVITSFRLITERQDFSSVRTGENTVRARARIQRRNNRKCRHDADLMTWNSPPALSGRMDLSKSTKEEKFHAKKKNTRKKH